MLKGESLRFFRFSLQIQFVHCQRFFILLNFAGLVAVVSVIILAVFCYYRKKRVQKVVDDSFCDQLHNDSFVVLTPHTT